MLLRPCGDERKFLTSLEQAENAPRRELNPDGNRAVIYCSTTDPYQVFRSSDAKLRDQLARAAEYLVRRIAGIRSGTAPLCACEF